MPALTAGGPVLVHFLDFAQLNSVRTLPYLVEWNRRYRDAGLSTIGVQAPTSPSAPTRMPSQSAWSTSASTSRWRSTPITTCGPPTAARAGPASSSGASAAPSPGFTSARANTWRREAIQAELREIDALRELPAPMALRPTDGPGARVMAPTAEIFPGGSWERPWTAGEDGEELVVDYEAGGAYATVEGEGEIEVELDETPGEPLAVTGPDLLTRRAPSHESHTIAPRPPPGSESGRSASQQARWATLPEQAGPTARQLARRRHRRGRSPLPGLAVADQDQVRVEILVTR